MMVGEEVKYFIKISTEFLYKTKSSHYSGTKNSTKWLTQFLMLLSTNFVYLSLHAWKLYFEKIMKIVLDHL